MNIKIRNTLAEITGALIAITWMWLNLIDALTIQSISKVLAQVIGISIVTTFVLLGWFNLNITTGLIAVILSGFIVSIFGLLFKIYLYR
ncbi:hypothetical protein OAK13_01990 [Candidatus Thioglobus sp.]|nr:hypothetical protein [Candidatus Thioglobus sp.]